MEEKGIRTRNGNERQRIKTRLRRKTIKEW